jgi:hypothetical protein
MILFETNTKITVCLVFNSLAYMFKIIMCLLLKMIKLTEIEFFLWNVKIFGIKEGKNKLSHIFHTYVFDGPSSAM